MLGAAGIIVPARVVQTRQVGLRFSDRDFARMDKAAQDRGMGKSTLGQQLILEWLDSLGQDGE
jgi:hypothetical protein